MFVVILMAWTVLMVCSMALAGGGEPAGVSAGLKDWIPFIGSTAAGVIGALVLMLPSIRKLGYLFTEVSLEINKFILKYSGVLQGEMKSDFLKILFKLDTAFDLLATILGRFGAKKLSLFLSNIIKSEWYGSNK